MRAPLGCLRCHRPFRARPRPTCPRTPCPESRARFGAERTRRPSRAARACLCRPGGRTGRPPAMPLGAYSRPVSRYCSERRGLRVRGFACDGSFAFLGGGGPILRRMHRGYLGKLPDLCAATGRTRESSSRRAALRDSRGSTCAAECHSRFGSALRERRGKRSTRLPSRPNTEKVI